MAAENVTIQPRKTPPKPAQAARLKQAAQAAADAAQMAASFQEPKVPAGGVPEGAKPLEGVFPDPAELITLPPSPETTPISNVDKAAGIPDPNPVQTVETESSEAKKVLQPNPQGPTPTPPRTREEYLAQQRGDVAAFPEVTDIFMGKIPGHKPINNPYDNKPPAPPPPVVREVIVTHEPPPLSAAYQLTRNFRGYLGDTFAEFDKGQVIYEPCVVEELMQGGFDGLVPVEVAQQWKTCPACNHQFPDEAG